MNKNTLLAFTSILVLTAACIFVGLSGVIVALLLTQNNDIVPISEADRQAQDAAVLNIASNYVNSGELETARSDLAGLGIPNPDQYVAFMIDRYLQENRSPEDEALQNLYQLAIALGSNTEAMAALLEPPTPTPANTDTPTPLPTETPTEVPTLEPTATETPVPLPTNTPIPTETPTEAPTEEPTATETPIPVDTPTPAPPTNTPEPTATPEPEKPAVDFRIAEERMYTIDENGGCRGSHQIFVTVLDVNGNPLDGVGVVDTYGAVPMHMSGEKGPGKLEYDLWNNGFQITVAQDTNGAPVTSEVTAKLSSWDEDIPDEWLVQNGYCADMADCAVRKGSNQLCRGHYSYSVIFQKTH